MSTASEVIDTVLEDIFDNGDGSVWERDVLTIVVGLGLPDTMFRTVWNTLEELAYNREVANAFEGDARWAIDKYILEPGEHASLDTSVIESYIHTHRQAEQDSLALLYSFVAFGKDK